jgi:hypothetical protein
MVLCCDSDENYDQNDSCLVDGNVLVINLITVAA